MKTILSILFITGMIFLNADLAEANKNQRHRMRQGVKNGKITNEEAHKIRKQNRENKKEIHQMKKDAKADGSFTNDEKKEIRQERRKNRRQMNKQIHRAKNNAKNRPKGPPRGSKPSTGGALEEIPVE